MQGEKVIDVGEFVTCENGHVIGEVVKAVHRGMLGWGECVGHWRIEHPPQIGDRITPCPCGAPYVRGWGSFHIEGRGWV
jgi:hypothetical protein